MQPLTPDPFIVRLRERPELDAHELLLLRRVGGGQVEYMAPGIPDMGHLNWHWQRTEPGVTLEHGQGIIAQVPTDALFALSQAATRAAGAIFELPAGNAAEARVLREVLAHERGRVDGLLEHLGSFLGRIPTHIVTPEGWRPG